MQRPLASNMPGAPGSPTIAVLMRKSAARLSPPSIVPEKHYPSRVSSSSTTSMATSLFLLARGHCLTLMMTETNPKFVNFEMDIFWVVFPAQDPVKLLEKYPKRWTLMHLKDMRKGLKTGELTGQTDVTNDVAIGAGQMDIPAILKAAKKAGVKYYFIEDESPSVIQQLPESLHYLENVQF